MSKLNQEELLVQVDFWGKECRICAEHHNYSCETGCPHQQRCEQAYQQLKEMIQKPEVTEEWIEAKAIELNYLSIYSSGRNQRAFAIGRAKAEDFIRSLVEEIK